MRRRRKIFIQIIKNSFLREMMCGYLAVFLLVSLAILLAEPSISYYRDALWYTFVACTTIGFGDFVAATLIGRAATGIIYVYTVLLLALITAMFTQFILEIAKAERDGAITELQYDLEHLPELPKEKLEEISRKIKDISKN